MEIYYLICLISLLYNVYVGIMFYKMRNKEYVNSVYEILLESSKVKNVEKVLKNYGIFHFVLSILVLILFFINVFYTIIIFYLCIILENIFFVFISKKGKKLKYIVNLFLFVIILLFTIKSIYSYKVNVNIQNVSNIIIIENGVSDFEEISENDRLNEILKSDIKNIEKMKDKKIELYDQKGKLLIKSDLYEADVKVISTGEYKKIENIIKYNGKYYKIDRDKEQPKNM